MTDVHPSFYCKSQIVLGATLHCDNLILLVPQSCKTRSLWTSMKGCNFNLLESWNCLDLSSGSQFITDDSKDVVERRHLLKQHIINLNVKLFFDYSNKRYQRNRIQFLAFRCINLRQSLSFPGLGIPRQNTVPITLTRQPSGTTSACCIC